MSGLPHRTARLLRVAGVLLAAGGVARLVQHAVEDGVALALTGLALLVAGLVFAAPPPVFDNEWKPVGTDSAPGEPHGPAGPPPAAAAHAPSPALTRAEALAVLGLEGPAGPRETLAAYRRAMMAAHPDRGGTAERAARVTAARDALLGRRTE